MINCAFYFILNYRTLINLSYRLFFLVFITSSSIFSQNFERLNTQNLKGGYLGFSSFIDYNNDGHLDIFVTGLDFDNDFSNAVFYKNNGDLSFTESNITNIPRVIYGDHSWGDFDNNGTQDLLYTGTTGGGSGEGITKIYRNLKNGCEFIELPVALPGISRGNSKWVDIDNDGLLDVFLVGFDINDKIIIKAFKNGGDDSFIEQPLTTIENLPGGRGNLSHNKARWEDLDGDGLQDLIIALASELAFTFEVYKNLGDFQFIKQNIGLPKLSYIAMEIGDINNDGLSDIIFTGSPNLENSSGDGTGDFYVFTNNGNMNFINTFTIANEGVFYNDIELGDINNDGFLDAVNYGTGPWGTFPEITKIYKNNRDGSFSNFLHNLPDCRFGGIKFGDFDNDNDLDVLYYGRIEDPSDNEITYIYKNKLNTVETPTEIVVTHSCICDNTLNFTLNNESDSLKWDFGDPTTGTLNTSSDKKATHLFSNETNYTVSATYTKGTTTNTLTTVINIIGLPNIIKPTDFTACNSNDINQFDFNILKDAEILNGESTDNFEVFYYDSLENSEEDRYRLKMPYNNQNMDQTIYARVQSIINSNCYLITDFKIINEEPPIANPVDNFFVCDDDNDGFSIFNLALTEKTIIGNQNNVYIEYFNSLGEVIPLNSLTNYQNSKTNFETITARIINTKNNCFAETSFNLNVNQLPVANLLDVLSGCDDNNDGISEYFDTSMVESDVIGNQTNVKVSFYNNEGIQLPELPNPYTNTTLNKEVITVRVTDIHTNCYAETPLQLQTTIQESCLENPEYVRGIDYPKFFTPNGDGYNDYWQIKNINKYPNSNIFIFDRYGKLLKQLSQNSLGWDGVFNGKMMQATDYWFKVYFSNGKTFSGHFTLKR